MQAFTKELVAAIGEHAAKKECPTCGGPANNNDPQGTICEPCGKYVDFCDCGRDEPDHDVVAKYDRIEE